ncbi:MULTISPECIES: cupin domain-containing protein [unclassified Acinetobacter]|uniref:ribosomal protein uL16 3-hydroxylase n=1 Tax=unclassified Acinetobacter TaxID=196816 RepID=UPI00244A2399|nr:MULTISPECIES: cupin domain-containing protein [unclassified Acinetobacter]MDH0032066.1 cupin domain-containing protein [Acinetobacter sp. GD04021]MDH0887722.1 cupin domain-containing protein [Acinetobacter sp. GD03873]MDH1084070.1 cupin domain-containing protein [Acinetobacter sp. GD03983]MDH2191003.1 cupin domain-containing protein [Acinetobacter sp. GD03645]MDH2204582.1 cupin domain-containing protein [Acinetobacter sp. GD03647]
MSQPLTVFGGITAEQFLTEYWQKKPLLVRNAMPEIVGLIEPDDVRELALEEHVSARLIRQKNKNPNEWHVKSSPLSKSDFQKLPNLWTLLVQAIDHYSFDIAELWKKFPFIPQWRRDDIMVSYAPKGGSVGKHFDFYDVFLVQGHGHRRWQLGQMCDESTEFVADQPLKLLPEMDVHFDEVLAPGDLLYVPPGLSHYGVAEDECLTFSFGFRMPNLAEMMDRISDQFAENTLLKNPLLDIPRQQTTAIGEINETEFSYLKSQLLDYLHQAPEFDAAIMAYMSEVKYPDNIPEPEEIEANDLIEIVDTGYALMLEPAMKLLYRQQNGSLEFWANGEPVYVSKAFEKRLQQLANGESLIFDKQLNDTEILEDIAHLLNDAILMLLPPN